MSLRKMQGCKIVPEKVKVNLGVNFIHSVVESHDSKNILHPTQVLVAIHSLANSVLRIHDMCIYWTEEKSSIVCWKGTYLWSLTETFNI